MLGEVGSGDGYEFSVQLGNRVCSNGNGQALAYGVQEDYADASIPTREGTSSTSMTTIATI
eukprot:4135397-Amphidinium_carterae.1